MQLTPTIWGGPGPGGELEEGLLIVGDAESASPEG